MKRATIFLFLVLLAVLSLGKGNLILYGWSDYIPEEVIENFSKEYDVKVTYDTYDSNETMFAKLKA
ncbi:MAG TPA: spermidine/putrescine ABC transporter substrate-binding protein, partial [Mesotoga infera]|nr:spermidine/putrescine ABC transporter substrate-binding protein [Mesotoga infera]